jgi:hypothetical protein
MSWIRRASALAVIGLGTAGLLVLTPSAVGTPAPAGVVVQHALPDTEILEGPPKQTPSRKARFVFAADPTATYTCALDKKPATACTSPYKVKKLKPGKHKLTVTATDAAGNADPSPAVFKWKVLKKKRHRISSGQRHALHRQTTGS